MVNLKLRILLDDTVALGPGKAALLNSIIVHGSISAAARDYGMSYRRAWRLVDEMNRCFAMAVVETVVGGAQGGGAQVTPFGRILLARYHTMQETAQAAIAADEKWFRAQLAMIN